MMLTTDWESAPHRSQSFTVSNRFISPAIGNTKTQNVVNYRWPPLASLPWFWRNSTSCWEKVVMEMDLTLWGGLRPLLGHRGDREEECGGKQGMNKKIIYVYLYIYLQKTKSKHVWSILVPEREGGQRGQRETSWHVTVNLKKGRIGVKQVPHTLTNTHTHPNICFSVTTTSYCLHAGGRGHIVGQWVSKIAQ